MPLRKYSSKRYRILFTETNNPSSLARRQQLETEGEIECNAEGLGEGGFWSWEPRNLVCYWRNDAGDVQITCGKEGGTMRMPWNALAKWS